MKNDEIRAEIDELVKDAYLAGWHDTAPTYENPEIAKSADQIMHLITEQTRKAEQVDRIEVIDETGRVYVKGSIYGTPVKVELDYQDEGRTLKVFVEALKPHHKAEE